jgi:hypothetical protein
VVKQAIILEAAPEELCQRCLLVVPTVCSRFILTHIPVLIGGLVLTMYRCTAAPAVDLLQELCQRCLKYNKSCAHAWELLGSIAEREAAYADAAAHYEQAWRLASQSSCVLGYKLSFNYLKAARCVDAVTVAQAVLKLDPNYPAIEKEVLQKAWAGLRP